MRSAVRATDDCGFSPLGIDAKPKYGSPEFAREVAIKKIKARVEGGEDGEWEVGYLIVGKQKCGVSRRLGNGFCSTDRAE